jgi:hypothetical protein
MRKKAAEQSIYSNQPSPQPTCPERVLENSKSPQENSNPPAKQFKHGLKVFQLETLISKGIEVVPWDGM